MNYFQDFSNRVTSVTELIYSFNNTAQGQENENINSNHAPVEVVVDSQGECGNPDNGRILAQAQEVQLWAGETQDLEEEVVEQEDDEEETDEEADEAHKLSPSDYESLDLELESDEIHEAEEEGKEVVAEDKEEEVEDEGVVAEEEQHIPMDESPREEDQSSDEAVEEENQADSNDEVLGVELMPGMLQMGSFGDDEQAKKALALLRAGRFQDALNAIRGMLMESKAHAQLAGEVFFFSGRFKQAVKYLGEDNPYSRLLLITALQRLGKLDSAMDMCVGMLADEQVGIEHHAEALEAAAEIAKAQGDRHAQIAFLRQRLAL